MKFRVFVDLWWLRGNRSPLQVRLDLDPAQWAAFRAALRGNGLRRFDAPDLDGWRMWVPLIVKAPSITDAAEIGVDLVRAAAERVWGPGVWVEGTCGVRHTGIRALLLDRNVSRSVHCSLMPPSGGGSGGDREPRRPAPSTFPPAAVALDDPRTSDP